MLAMENKAATESEFDMDDIQVVQLGQVVKRKNWHEGDPSRMDVVSRFSKVSKAQTLANQSISGFSSLDPNVSVKFLNNSHQNHQEQLREQQGYVAAKKQKEQQEANKKQNKKDAKVAKTLASNPNAQELVPRAKRNKIKKMKQKYGDQDEEERVMRLTLLGAKDV